MTTPATDAPVATREKRGLSKFVSRVKSRLRRDASRRRSPAAMQSPVAAESSAPSASAPPATVTSTETSKPTADVPPDATDSGSKPTVVPSQRTTVELERARKLAQKYDIELEPREWNVIEVAERVEKPIRMRIHRTCHLCGTAFGANRLCATCQHRRCDECPRYPKKKLPADKEKELRPPPDREGPSGTTPGGEAIDGLKRKHTYALTLPSRTGGHDLVYKKVLQRVRRNCHRCDAVFMPGNRTCPKCGHNRCVNCPRDPPKQKKFPDGYPGDTFGSSDDDSVSSAPRVYKPRRVPRYSCHDCQAIFVNGNAKCPNCGHEKCSKCSRVPPRKVIPGPDPEVVRRVEERLKAMDMSSMVEQPPEEGLTDELVVDESLIS